MTGHSKEGNRAVGQSQIPPHAAPCQPRRTRHQRVPRSNFMTLPLALAFKTLQF
jgi:hypothetical protein